MGRSEVESHVGVPLEPVLVLLVSVEIVENDMQLLAGICRDDRSMKSRNSMRRRRFLWAAVTLPLATSNAANSVEVPCRL